jgi:DNA-binding NtrC family response regulator
VIMITAFETTDTLVQALRLRAFDYINMPFEIETMRSAVSKAIQRRILESDKAAARKKSSINSERGAKQAQVKRRDVLLIVDDEDGPRQSLRVIFQDEYDLVTAEDGPTAIKLAQENEIDVAVLNIRMPGMSGIEVLERLKYVNPDIEVIMTTGFVTNDTILQALRLRAFDYITKPFDIETMRSAVSKAIHRRKHEAK